MVRTTEQMITYDDVLRSVLRGQPLDELRIVDCHAHIGRNFNLPRHASTADSLLRTMDATGIQVSCVSSSDALGPAVSDGNDSVLEAVRLHPERLVGAMVVNPRYEQEVVPELERVFATGGASMLKLHPEGHAYPIDGPGYAPALDFANRRRLPVLIHTWGEGRGYDHPDQVDRLAADYPNANLIMAHAGGVEAGVLAAARSARRRPNVFLDTATSLVYRGVVEFLLREVGPDKIVFGSDATYLSHPPQIAKVVAATTDMGILRRVLGGTMAGLLSTVVATSEPVP